MDAGEKDAPDNTAAFVASFAVCALAVAGVSMSKQNARANREQAVRACAEHYRRRMAAPAMQLQLSDAPVGTAQAAGAVARQRGVADVDSSILVQGGSLRTWSYRSPLVEQVQ